MEYITIVIKVFIFISIINVWLLRFNKPTSWRGGQALNMREEFKSYGLSETVMYFIGALKLLSALLLLVSIWLPVLTWPAASIMAILMFGAIVMHLKIDDPPKKSFPALSFLILSVTLIIHNIL